jgi:hypothetical protein
LWLFGIIQWRCLAWWLAQYWLQWLHVC